MSDLKNHWSGFLTALGKSSSPASSNSVPFETSSSKIGVSGFLDLKPANPAFQARYDAMSGSWEGVSASEKAVLQPKKITEFMSWSHR
jgi:hypothetical protein